VIVIGADGDQIPFDRDGPAELIAKVRIVREQPCGVDPPPVLPALEDVRRALVRLPDRHELGAHHQHVRIDRQHVAELGSRRHGQLLRLPPRPVDMLEDVHRPAESVVPRGADEGRLAFERHRSSE
jgi:hypothetical protein